MSRYQKYKATYQAYEKNHRAELREIRQQWLKKHPTYRENYVKAHKESIKKTQANWRRNNRHKKRAHKLINSHPQDYPLLEECEFCGSREKLEHGHIDYDFPEIYLTVCHKCNCWMERPLEKTEKD